MVGMVDVVIPVEAEAAAALSDSRKRESVGRIVSRILRPHPDTDLLVKAIERLSADAHAKGLMDEVVEVELAPTNQGGPADRVRCFDDCQCREGHWWYPLSGPKRGACQRHLGLLAASF